MLAKLNAITLTVVPPSANSDNLGSNRACRGGTSRPVVVLHLKKCLLGVFSSYIYLQLGC